MQKLKTDKEFLDNKQSRGGLSSDTAATLACSMRSQGVTVLALFQARES